MKLCPKTERPGPVPEPDACFSGRAIKSQKEPDESNEEETAMNKHIDRLGRIVIPHDIRDKMKVTPLDTFHVYYENGKIIIEKSAGQCIFCGKTQGLVQLGDLAVCGECRRALKEAKSGDVIPLAP